MLKDMLKSTLPEFSHLLLFLDYLLVIPFFQKSATITLEVMDTLQKFHSKFSEFYNWKVRHSSCPVENFMLTFRVLLLEGISLKGMDVAMVEMGPSQQ
ncbi:hypothetical protein DKX38_023257 [Salix brachista]|uniref:Uncharacterized protein n=1 Tax=Salix brachista TaxID=2182728 RepID=A0A5N5JIJ2_9ROSI|nr:hypothetical protein DKX38_023257 [Salix brachista]